MATTTKVPYQKVQPLDYRTPIVNPNGTPSDQFIRIWQQLFQNGEFTNGNVDAKADKTTKIIAGVGLGGGGTLAADVTLNLEDTAVTPGLYGDATHVGQFTVDQQGRITAATNVAVSGGGGGANWWFQPPLASAFTLANGTGHDFVTTDDTNVGLILDAGAPVSGDKSMIAYQTVTTTDKWQVTARLDCPLLSANYSSFGLYMWDSVANRVSTLSHSSNQTGVRFNLNGLNSYSAEVDFPFANWGDTWLRIKHNTTTNQYEYYFSTNGKAWSLFYSESDTAWLTNKANRVGIGVLYNRGSGAPVVVTCSYWKLEVLP